MVERAGFGFGMFRDKVFLIQTMRGNVCYPVVSFCVLEHTYTGLAFELIV